MWNANRNNTIYVNRTTGESVVRTPEVIGTTNINAGEIVSRNPHAGGVVFKGTHRRVGGGG